MASMAASMGGASVAEPATGEVEEDRFQIVFQNFDAVNLDTGAGGNLDDVQMPKTVVAGTNQVSIDAYGTTIMGWKPTDLPSLVEAASRGLGEMDLTKLRIFEGTA